MHTTDLVGAVLPRRTFGFWTIYDELCSAIPMDAFVDDFVGGLHWFGVQSGRSMGLAMAPREIHLAPSLAGRVAGRDLRSVSALAKSWNFADAALGIAAMNAHYNTPARVECWAGSARYRYQTGANAFTTLLPRVVGKKVAVIGHFRGLEELAAVSELTILERRPQTGDAPDPACEVVLPEADFVFITGTTLINKTLPRLLDLCPKAFVVIVGPTTPLSPAWFDLGVDMVAGLLIDEIPAVWKIVQEGGQHSFFSQGTRMIQIERVVRTGADGEFAL